MEIQLLSQKIDNIQSLICNRLDKWEENKDAYQQFLKEREISNGKDDTITEQKQEITNLRTELEVYKERERKAQLSQANPVLKGAKFEEDSQVILTDLCKYKDNVVLKTDNIAHSTDNILIFQNFFKVAVDWKNYKVTENKNSEESCYIDKKQVKKIMSDAQNVKAHAAILVYPSLDKYSGLCDFMYDELGKPAKAQEFFDKNMVIACTPERIYEALLTLMARYMQAQSKIKTITEENTIITQNLSKLCQVLMKTVRPLCEAFGTDTTQKKDSIHNWGQDVGKLILNLQNECNDRTSCDANLIALKKEVNEILDILQIKTSNPNVFSHQKRKLEDVSHKKAKVDEKTGETQIEY